MGRFDFKQFSVDDGGCAMKVGTDSVLLGAWTAIGARSQIIDLGTGSGILALMLAQRCPKALITAIEIDETAAEAAKANFEASPWSGNITAVNADALTYTPATRPDLIVCNPPYFADSLKSPDSQRSQARHTGAGVFGPLACVRLAQQWLADDGSLAMITPAGYEGDVVFEAEMARLNVWRTCRVTTIEGKAPSRILWQLSKCRDLRHEGTELSIRQSDKKTYTQEYIQLTKEFYLHL